MQHATSVAAPVYFRNCKLQSCITILTVTDWLLLEKGSLQQLYSVDITRCLEGAVLSHLRYRCSANFIVKCKKCIFFANRFTLCGKPFKSFGCGNVSNKDFLKQRSSVGIFYIFRLISPTILQNLHATLIFQAVRP